MTVDIVKLSEAENGSYPTFVYNCNSPADLVLKEKIIDGILEPNNDGVGICPITKKEVSIRNRFCSDDSCEFIIKV